MRFVFRLLKWLLAVVVLAIVGAFFLPAVQQVERSQVVAAPAERIWPLIADPRQWQRWSPWAARDPRMRLEYGGPASGAGAWWAWKSDSEGSGRMQFETANAPVELTYRLEFPDMGSTAKGAFRIVPADGGSRVTWSFHTDAGLNPVLRWFGLLLDRMVGADFEQGLTGLAKAAGSA